ncbi:MAG: DEAD/DEAH box helicase [Gammaproteobacteria bacterium]
MTSEASFHPAVARWFRETFGQPTLCQRLAWPAILSQRHTLISAPTGSGKTLAAFLAAIDGLVRTGLSDGGLQDQTSVVYVSPLKALSNDIHKNLEQPLAGIREMLRRQGLPDIVIRSAVRTGDTPPSIRASMRRQPPHIVVTTPESLYLLLTSESGREMLKTTRTVIVDEVHALVSSKRGSHLALSLERLQLLAREPLLHIGLSATQRPLAEVASFLTGSESTDCAIVDTGHQRPWDLAIELPASPLEAVMSNEVWSEVYEQLAALISEHRTTLIFVNTRRMAERVARHLSERLGASCISAHHGSLSREQRLNAEQRLKAGQLKALVATASLELGIDIGDIDLVCQLGTTPSIATLLQRAGRAGHSIAGIAKARLFPLTRDELMQSAALLYAVRSGQLDRLKIPQSPLDVLAQQLVAMVACEEWDEEALFDCVRRVYPYRDLQRRDFDAVIRLLSEGIGARRFGGSAYIHRDAVHGRLRPRRGARLTAITCSGAIPDNADYQVRLEPSDVLIGTVNEDFAIESLAGDIFQLGNSSWRILRVGSGVVRVEDAQGQPPTIPFWLGEAPARSDELSAAVAEVRAEVAEQLHEPGGAQLWLSEITGVSVEAAEQLAAYLEAGFKALGAMPTQDTLVMERFFDESGGMQLVIHAPFGNRINRAWGLALRKRFCQRFNFELQAAASEDTIVLSLSEAHSFPLEEVWHYLKSVSVADVLTQAVLAAPMFTVRWRWNAACALAIPRFRGGRKVPARLQRMNAEDLMAAVFPDQMACQENINGRREIPDHPLVQQTLADCLTEAMDLAGITRLLCAIEAGHKRLVACDVTEPSPFAHAILNAKPYAFLDDAPLEERRTQAVWARRWLDPQQAGDLGRLDPQAIARVKAEFWPDCETADELHDALMSLGFLTEEELHAGPRLREQPQTGPAWTELFEELINAQRATCVDLGSGTQRLWVAAERLGEIQCAFPSAKPTPALNPPAEFAGRSREDCLLDLTRSRLQALGPVKPEALAEPLHLDKHAIAAVLARLETEGLALRGRFGSPIEEQWCERRLLARIHRYTVSRLRAEIEPVSSAVFLRFLLRWQHLTPETRVHGERALREVVQQLQGFSAPAAAWEEDLLPARVGDYRPDWLDSLCLSGRVVWARLEPKATGAPIRQTPITLSARKSLGSWGVYDQVHKQVGLSATAQRVREYLKHQGASFFQDIVEATGGIKAQVQDALGELVSAGYVSSDSFAGLRGLLAPVAKRPRLWGKRSLASVTSGLEQAGRWALIAPPHGSAPAADEKLVRDEAIARALLRRYGIVFRRLLLREHLPLAWRDLLHIYHLLEARGEIRGGRFISNASGEHFALPEAVSSLRVLRREQSQGELVSVSGVDPLNLIGILTPGARVPAFASNRILYRDGIPVALQLGREVQFIAPLEGNTEWELRTALVRKVVPLARRAPHL